LELAVFSYPRLLSAMRAHWLAVALCLAGLGMRILAQVSYHPALLYVDSVKYLYGAWPGGDPLGYDLPLKAILAVGSLGLVEAFQHLLGLAMAVTLYVVLLRRGVPRWLAALAIAPVLLDGYQLAMEATIMPNVWFEALIVAALALLLYRPVATWVSCAVAGLLLGYSATVWQPGEVLVLPLVVFIAVTAGGWLAAVRKGAIAAAAFALPILAYCVGSYDLTGHFWLSDGGFRSSYGHVAEAANCATLRIPKYERALCPSAFARAQGPDWLDHDSRSPVKLFKPPPGVKKRQAVSGFMIAVLKQQPLPVLAQYFSDAKKLFAVVRVTSPGDTPLSRWQFQDVYQQFPPTINLNAKGQIVLGLILRSSGGPVDNEVLKPAYGGKAQVWTPGAKALRAYQRDGGYTPGPVLLLTVLLGLAGSLLVFRRRLSARRRQLVVGCLLFFTSAVVVLLMANLIEFSWRYQLFAVITLPPAGAFGLAALRRDKPSQAEPATSQETEAPAAAHLPAGNGTPPAAGHGAEAGDSPAPAGRYNPVPGGPSSAPEPVNGGQAPADELTGSGRSQQPPTR
jgi:hypothetical protein